MQSGSRFGAAHNCEQTAGFREVLEADGLGAGEPGDVPDRGLEGWIDRVPPAQIGVQEKSQTVREGLGRARCWGTAEKRVSRTAWLVIQRCPSQDLGGSGSVQAGPRGGPSAPRSQYTELRPSPDDLPALSREDEALQGCPGAWRLFGGEAWLSLGQGDDPWRRGGPAGRNPEVVCGRCSRDPNRPVK